MAQHTNYWSCTPFADWLRGTPKGGAKTSEEWDEWHTQASQAHPICYWLADTALDYIQDFITWPIRKIYDAKYYINNRWVTRSHSLTAHARDIQPGAWCDVGNRFLPCLFNELVDFVEIETAWSHIAWSDKKDTEKYNPPFWAKGWFRWRTWRCPQAGLDNLNWQAQLRHDEDYCKDEPYYGEFTPQAIKAQEILSLYTWWTQTYRNRPDAYDASGWTAYCELGRLANGGKLSFSNDKTPELKTAGELAHKELQRIETEYEQEDEAMMIRLIKVRHALWT
jgi:hypothetical protein